ncbi:BON domain-containing protein [Candidatus Magnetaquicoccus inordinatus]|uniref:BON domain-containing protein n=1 Tax=Candidatus Magnetaquicoccus inordinatus TaxID=2496818 RepID=UPI00187D6B5F|nr:BON domain-containing protein [Candidatus Magnetaquicoccus inordinatus]
MKRITCRHLVTLLALTGLPGCVPVVVGGGMAATTSMVGEDRDMGSQMEDSWLAMKIRSRFVQSDAIRVGNIGVSVLHGKVLLTGAAMNQEEVEEAIRIARETRGVVEVRSELKVQYVSPSELANDAVITSKVKSQFILDQDVHGLNIHVKTTKGVVYLVGEAKTVQERDRAIHIAQQVADVREVVSYLTVANAAAAGSSKGAPVTVRDGAATPAASQMSAPVEPVSSSPPVNVQPSVRSSGTVNESISPIAPPGSGR